MLWRKHSKTWIRFNFLNQMLNGISPTQMAIIFILITPTSSRTWQKGGSLTIPFQSATQNLHMTAPSSTSASCKPTFRRTRRSNHRDYHRGQERPRASQATQTSMPWTNSINHYKMQIYKLDSTNISRQASSTPSSWTTFLCPSWQPKDREDEFPRLSEN